MPRTPSLALLALGLALPLLACQPSGPGGKLPSIVFVLIDTLRPDHLQTYGYEHATAPVLDALAKEGVVFERVVAPSSWTKTSMASIWTGLDPGRHGVKGTSHALPDRLLTLAEHLKEAGYQTLGVNTNPWLLARFGFDAGFETYHSAVRADGAAVNDAVFAMLASARRPLFLYVHYMDVHAPYTPDSRFFDEPLLRVPGGERIPDARLEHLYRKGGFEAPGVEKRVKRLYDGGISAADEAVGALMEGLRKLGALEDSVVVITSDHGESFREHGTAEHGFNLYPEVIQVPLLLIAPGRIAPGQRVSAQVRSIDLAPTLLALAGLPIPAAFEGSSLVPVAEVEARVASSSVTSTQPQHHEDWDAVVSADHLYLRERRSNSVEFYDLRSDPGALHDLGAGHPQASALAALMGVESEPAPEDVEMDAQTRQQLEELGYLDSEP